MPPLRIDSGAEPIPGYRLIERLGSGGFGEVWKAEAPGKLLKAIKIIHGDLRHGDADGNRQAEQELKAIQRVQAVRHPYLLSLERWDIIEGRLLIVMELADCNLWDRFRKYRTEGQTGIPRIELLRYMEESAEVLDMMNTDYQLQHLDIKPQNLFLVYNHVKVADFGLVKDLENMKAAVTGGVTPVYAAPETFRNEVTPYCDQYSLAIVYQELLTGVRPFHGSSPHHLLMQHLQSPPNLQPLPHLDRAIVGRSLSKKAEDRFPSCLAFVRALIQADSGTTTSGPGSSPSLSRAETPSGKSPSGSASVYSAAPPAETPRTESRGPNSRSYASMEMLLPLRIAPPEVTGEGCIVPSLVIGLGGYGHEVLTRLRRQVHDRLGALQNLPSLRMLYIDTDTDSTQKAVSPDLPCPFRSEEVISTPLNRAAHYLKPRRNGRNLIDGWFDPQMLYRIPRNPSTQGSRSLGRLAFCDHYRIIAKKIRDDLEAIVTPDALGKTTRETLLGLRSNRPKIYIVADLSGGTGSGMLLDMAYLVRHQLISLGYADPEVIGILHLPTADRRSGQSGQLVNCYTALRELNHFSLPETVFASEYEDRSGNVSDPSPPFNKFFLFTPAVAINSREPNRVPTPETTRPADFLRRELFSLLGRTADEERQNPSNPEVGEVNAFTVGQTAFAWPRQELLTLAGRWLSAAMLARWLASDRQHLRNPVQTWIADRWSLEELSAESLLRVLQHACEVQLGESPEQFFTTETQPFIPRGWFPRAAEPTKILQTLLRLQNLVGMPDENCVQRQAGQFEQTLVTTADQLIRETAPKVLHFATTLLEHPDYRMVGAEEGVTQLLSLLEQQLQHYLPLSQELSQKAAEAYYLIQNQASGEQGSCRISPADLAELMKNFPRWRYQSLVVRQLCRIYAEMKSQLGDQLRELRFCRQRLETIAERFQEGSVEISVKGDFQLLPPGCQTVSETLAQIQTVVTSEDLRSLDMDLQTKIQADHATLYQLCMSSEHSSASLENLILDLSRKLLANRMQSVRLVDMFFSRFPDMESAAKALKNAWEQAQPPFTRPGGKSEHEMSIFSIPQEQATIETFRPIARRALPHVDMIPASSVDEILLCRECARVPLADLPHLGPLAEESYRIALTTPQGSPHSRIDIQEWFEVEVSH